MDTINQAVAGVKSALGYDTPATTATTATNETAGREPISGEQGAGTITEPFDKGNETTATTTTTTAPAADTSSYHPSSAATTTDPSSSTETSTLPTHIKSDPSGSTTDTPSSSSNPTTMSSSTPSQPGMNTSGNITSDTQASGTSSAATNQPMSTGAPAGQSRPDAGSRPGDVRPTEANENRPNTNVGGFGTAEPSVNADPKSAQQPKTAKEGSDRPLDEPDHEETAAIKSDKSKVENEQHGQSDGSTGGSHKPISDEEREKLAEKGKLPHDPNDHSGEPMHMHGGDGSDDPKKEEKEEEKSAGGVTEKQRKDSIGQEGGDPHGSSKGTGEQYVKSTGLAADGGDFDAAKPGAAKEATRLMQEKGMHKDDGSGPASSGGSAVGGDHKDADDKAGKPSMMQKLKDKMNPGTGSGLD